ncbi:alpha/beta hydrolase [Shimia ponticola]|uniref:alpha/beta hydrolase n=1 Tax=Shimia ponticola TaxID=2582893 RepID=UPI00164C0FBC|nr:alpha/beta hydrolase [Shimia ponticola]
MSWPDLGGLEAWLAEREAMVPHLRAGCEKQVHWAGEIGVQTDLSIVVIHGFSASAIEMQPVPERLAAALGANLFFTRLDGHGADGAAMGRATFAAWMDTAHETLRIGRMLGQKVLVMSCSTGCPLAVLAAQDEPEQIAGHVLVSPNFRLKSGLARAVFRLPWFEVLGKLIIGRERWFRPRNEAHARGWTFRYPFEALIALRDTLVAFDRRRPRKLTAPALIMVSDRDQTIDPAYAREVGQGWSARIVALEMGPGDDPGHHVILGDAMSPGQTEPGVATIADWVRAEILQTYAKMT